MNGKWASGWVACGVILACALSMGFGPTDLQGNLLAGPSKDLLNGDTEKSDTVALSKVGRGFYCEVAGDVKFKTFAGTTVTVALAAKTPFPTAATQVFSTGTTATGLWVFAD